MIWRPQVIGLTEFGLACAIEGIDRFSFESRADTLVGDQTVIRITLVRVDGILTGATISDRWNISTLASMGITIGAGRVHSRTRAALAALRFIISVSRSPSVFSRTMTTTEVFAFAGVPIFGLKSAVA